MLRQPPRSKGFHSPSPCARRSQMAKIPGVGEAKLDRYGAAFLAVIADQAG